MLHIEVRVKISFKQEKIREVNSKKEKKEIIYYEELYATPPPPPDACSKSNVFSYIVKRVYPL